MVFKHLNKILSKKIFAFDQKDKDSMLIAALREVTMHHFEECKPYQTLCKKKKFIPETLSNIYDLPYLPTSIFKDTLLLSIPENAIFRTISSSATTSGRPSRIALDKETSQRQSKCFNKVVLERLGNKRRNFIILDTPDSIGKSKQITARSSTIRSLLFCAGETNTCINEIDGKLILDENKIDILLRKAEKSNDEIILFGFTYILHSHVIKELLSKRKKYNLNGSKILHIGGWKKLESEKVSPEKLISDCSRVFGVAPGNVVDFYGFTEQSGMIYPTCEEGFRHAPLWGDIIVRDPLTLKPLDKGRKGLMQFITPIQTSYPGHSILTEDIGYIEGVDTCPCGRKGAAFKIVGRAQHAEVRGCGDIMAEKFA